MPRTKTALDKPTRDRLARNAMHQRAYRERHLRSPDTVDAARLDLVVTPHAKAALVRLAKAYRVSQRAMLERLLSEAEGEHVSKLGAAEQTEYYR